jgi:uncharacterized protein (DUF736 family)
MQYDNTNKGVLFRDTEKAEGTKKPDYTGKLNVNGKDYRLAGWLKEAKNGSKFLSLAISEPKPKTGGSDEL